MHNFFKTLATGLTLSLFCMVGAAEATFFNNPTGLSAPSSTVTFDSSGLGYNTTVSNEFAGQGVTFTPSLRLLDPTASAALGSTGFTNDHLGNFSTAPFVLDNIDFSILFSTPVGEAAFAVVDQNNTWSFEAKLAGVIQDSSLLPIPSNPGAGFVGFTNVTFDEIRVFTTVTDALVAVDTLQFTPVQFTPVPEPSTYALMGSCLALVGIARKRKKAHGHV